MQQELITLYILIEKVHMVYVQTLLVAGVDHLMIVLQSFFGIILVDICICYLLVAEDVPLSGLIAIVSVVLPNIHMMVLLSIAPSVVQFTVNAGIQIFEFMIHVLQLKSLLGNTVVGIKTAR